MSRDLKRKCPQCGLFRRKERGRNRNPDRSPEFRAKRQYKWVDGICYVCVERNAKRPKDNELGPKSQLVASGDTPAT